MRLNFKNYRHISFDLWLTLIRSNPEFKKKRDELFRHYFQLKNPITEVSAAIRHFDLYCNSTSEETGLNIDSCDIYRMVLGQLTEHTEMEQKHLDEFCSATDQLFMQYKPELIYPDIRKLFTDIKRHGISMSILSNTAFIKGYNLKEVIRFYGLEEFFSFQVYSDECGFSKPNPKIFELVYSNINNRISIDKSDVLHVGDNHKADYEGALKYGFHALLITYEN